MSSVRTRRAAAPVSASSPPASRTPSADSSSGGSRRTGRVVLAVLLLASLGLITLDSRAAGHTALRPVRAVAGAVFGPAEDGVATAARPFAAVPRFFRTTDGLRHDVSRLRTENSQLRSRLAGADLRRNQVAEADGLVSTARSTGYTLVPAHVVAMGPAQTFSRTVTIDAGTRAGVHRDMTVLDNDGLVGRVLHASRTTATVLLIVDQESVVGGRLGSSMEIGFVRGQGQLGHDARMDLQLVDAAATASRGDAVVTWGSRHGAPYVAGIPIGRVDSVYTSPRQQSTRAVITPYVDFSSLDLVGVVAKKGVHSDRTVIRADGSTGDVPARTGSR